MGTTYPRTFNYQGLASGFVIKGQGRPRLVLAAAFALARAGELSRSQALLKNPEARFSQDTTVNVSYLAAKRPADAPGEFQKIISRRGLVMEDPIDAIARLQLARALVASGDTARARAAYQDFLTLWKQADADVPLLKQAQAEAATLR